MNNDNEYNRKLIPDDSAIFINFVYSNSRTFFL